MNVPKGLSSTGSIEDFQKIIEFEQQMFADGWAVVSWPKKYGGREASLWEWLIFEEEYFRAGGPHRVTQNGIFLLAPSIFAFGTQEQQDQILPRMAAGVDIWAQGWSEPGAGSDLASLTSRATRDQVRGGWVLNGQKTWTTRGSLSSHIFGLFRSDPESVRHKGLTYFLVPLDTPGVSVRPFARLDGVEEFAEIFFEDAFVSDETVLGEPGMGWNIAMATTGTERGLTLRSPGRFLATFARLKELALASSDPSAWRERMVQSWLDVRAYQLFTLASVTKIVDGAEMGPESSINKIHWSESDLRMHELAMDILGPESVIDDEWSRGFQFSLAGPIYAGTNEIQRNIIAERLLGLPRG
jgi:alkylation response protein AidB-like acyl-CoA dehydrogenase